MDALVVQKKPLFLPALAEAVAEWFPELNGRSLAVSDVTVTKENVPTLPLAMCAFVRSAANPPSRSAVSMYEIMDIFCIEFWLQPARYKKANDSETPFWSYYPYDTIRDTLLANLTRWETPGGERIAYRSLTIEADSLAVVLSFQFTATFLWCAPPAEIGIPYVIGFNLCTPEGCCPEICIEEPDPCQHEHVFAHPHQE
jgi:hypothetical protein